MEDNTKLPILSLFQTQNFKEELLSLNSVTSAYGLSLTSEDVAEILDARQTQQSDYGVFELTPTSTEEIITQICTSSYINTEEYKQTIIDFHELYYYLIAIIEETYPELIFKIETEYVISFLKKIYDENGGYIDAVRGKIERFFLNYSLVDDGMIEFIPVQEDDEDTHVINLSDWDNHKY